MRKVIFLIIHAFVECVKTRLISGVRLSLAPPRRASIHRLDARDPVAMLGCPVAPAACTKTPRCDSGNPDSQFSTDPKLLLELAYRLH